MAPGDETYPENLLRFPDPPPALRVKGSVEPGDRLAVAVVGTRSPTELGRRIAREIARDMAEAGVTIVSGLAEGIDAEAHRGALEAGGRTIACLGCGVDVTYPPVNCALYQGIPKSGALISEYPDKSGPLKWRFPRRNRVIVLMSLGVVVVEAGKRSGALITAEWAQEYGVPLMAVPGSVKSPKSAGANKLIQDGAYLVTNASDVLSFLRRESEYVPLPKARPVSPPNRQLSLEESLVLSHIQGSPLSPDAIADRISGISPGRLAAALSSLEVDGIVLRLAGGKYLANTGQATDGKGR